MSEGRILKKECTSYVEHSLFTVIAFQIKAFGRRVRQHFGRTGPNTSVMTVLEELAT